MIVTFSVIVPTVGRRSLTETLASITPQLEAGDEIMVVRSNHPWGHKARDEAITRAAGTHLLFMDDDDVFTPDAFKVIRSHVVQEPEKIHLFSMKLGNTVYEPTEPVTIGRIGTPMIVAPNQPGKLGSWGETEYEGDWNFLSSTIAKLGARPLCHSELIAIIRP